jgi:hypothetical protein
VVSHFEGKGPQLAARLAAADVSAFGNGTLGLVVPDRLAADAMDKNRAEIERVAAAALGETVRLVVTIGATAGAPTAAPVLRSAVGAESDAAAADKKRRETEARQHPLIQKAQDIFNAPLKEVKTP